MVVWQCLQKIPRKIPLKIRIFHNLFGQKGEYPSGVVKGPRPVSVGVTSTLQEILYPRHKESYGRYYLFLLYIILYNNYNIICLT